MALAADERLGTVGDGPRHEALDAIEVGARDERPDVGPGVHGVARDHVGERGQERRHAVVVHLPLEIDPGGRRAILTGVVRGAECDRVRHGAEVGVTEHGYGRLAPRVRGAHAS